MNKLSKVLAIASVVISGNLYATTDLEAIDQMSNVCEFKQVTDSCSVSTSEKVVKGQCVDAKRYGLVCLGKNHGN